MAENQLKIFNENGDVVFEGEHNEEENWPFTDENFHMTSSDECWKCTKRNVYLKDDGISIKVETVCASETRSVDYSDLGRMTTGRQCCDNVMKVPGLGTFKGGYCCPANPCCANSGKVEQFRNSINERVDWMEKNKKPAGVGNTTVIVQQAPQMMMAPPVMAAPMMMQPQMMQPQMMAAPQMVAVQQ